MHDTALAIGARFFEIYGPAPGATIVEVGSADVNGSLRQVAPKTARYIGVDNRAGPGVDAVFAEGERLPLMDQVADVVIASSVFEHDPRFWWTFEEMSRVVKDGGYIYLNAPSNGLVHHYPLDCWRFYPDAGIGLEQWAKVRKMPVVLVESFIAEKDADVWNDFVAVFRRGIQDADVSDRIYNHVRCTNVYDASVAERRNVNLHPQDMRDLIDANRLIEDLHLEMTVCVDERDRVVVQLTSDMERLNAELSAREHRTGELESLLAANSAREARLAAEEAERQQERTHLEVVIGDARRREEQQQEQVVLQAKRIDDLQQSTIALQAEVIRVQGQMAALEATSQEARTLNERLLNRHNATLRELATLQASERSILHRIMAFPRPFKR